MASIEVERVKRHIKMAQRVGTPATLTLAEWKQTIADFKGLCAYCQVKRFEVLEHFLPVHVAGTHVKNCLPACDRCNVRKGDKTGEALAETFGQGVIDRISQYLASRDGANEVVSPLEIPRKERWHTHPPKTGAHPPKVAPCSSVIVEKETYTLKELIESLCCSLREFGKRYNLNQRTIARLRDGKPALPDTVNRLLAGLSEVYGKTFTVDNVQGIIFRGDSPS